MILLECTLEKICYWIRNTCNRLSSCTDGGNQLKGHQLLAVLMVLMVDY